MVLAWIAAGAVTHRVCLAERPFKSRFKTNSRHWVSLAVESDALQRLGLPADANSGQREFLCLASVRPRFCYDHSRLLSLPEREQYYYWMGLDKGLRDTLWFFEVVEVHAFIASVPLQDSQTIRDTAKTFMKLSEGTALQLAAEIAAQLDAPLLALSAQDVRLCVKLAPPFARMVASGACKSFAIPSPFSSGEFGCPRRLLREISPDFAACFEPDIDRQWSRPDGDPGPFHWGLSGDLADSIRQMLPLLAAGQRENASRWIWQLQEDADASRCAKRWSIDHRAEELIQYVLLSDKLKNSGNLRDVLLRSCELVLPPHFHAEVKKRIDGAPNLPDEAAISRARLIIDVAIMLWRRCQNWLAARDTPHVRFVTWDSSPQFYRDYELVLLVSVKCSDLARLFRISIELGTIWEWDIRNPAGNDKSQFADCDKVRLEKQLMDEARACIDTHLAPACQIGFGHADFPKLFEVFGHSLRLEHFTNAGCAAFIAEISSCMADYGTERLLRRVEPGSMEDLCPFFEDTPERFIDMFIKGAASLPADLPPADSLPLPLPSEEAFEEVAAPAPLPSEVFEDVGHMPIPVHDTLY